MGEYAEYNGARIKIGTCEDMYYLRASHVSLLTDSPGCRDVANLRRSLDTVRFRFPWPDEDSAAPGAYDRFDRAVAVPGMTSIPDGVKHYSVQFSAARGYLLSLPCPEGPEGDPRVHRNGFAGKVQLVQQAYRNGHLAAILQCGGCGARWNLPTWEDAEPVIVAFRAEADKRSPAYNREWWHAVADRIAAGYGVTVPA